MYQERKRTIQYMSTECDEMKQTRRSESVLCIEMEEDSAERKTYEKGEEQLKKDRLKEIGASYTG